MNLNTKQKQILFVIQVASASSTATLVLASLFTLFFILLPIRKEAVDRGFAEWVVIDNSTGQTEFRWNEFATALHPENPDNILAEMEIK